MKRPLFAACGGRLPGAAVIGILRGFRREGLRLPVNEAAGYGEPRTKEDIGINEDVHGEAGRG